MSFTPVSPAKLQNVAKPITYLAVGLILLGVLSIALPRASGMTVGVMVGVLLLLSGVLRTTAAQVRRLLGYAPRVQRR